MKCRYYEKERRKESVAIVRIFHDTISRKFDPNPEMVPLHQINLKHGKYKEL